VLADGAEQLREILPKGEAWAEAGSLPEWSIRWRTLIVAVCGSDFC